MIDFYVIFIVLNHHRRFWRIVLVSPDNIFTLNKYQDKGEAFFDMFDFQAQRVKQFVLLNGYYHFE